MAQQQQRVEILLPPGRFVAGSAYKPRDKDAEGKPLVFKNGPNTGKPRVDYFVAIAIPKIAGHTHWAHTDWGQKIYNAGAAAFPQQYQMQDFAWKVEDGDSTVKNKKGLGRAPCENEGWPGHWVVKLSGGYAPKIFTQPQPGQYVEVTEPEALKTGYWVQASINVVGNGSPSQPGVHLNHAGLLFLKTDTVIVTSGINAATAFAGAAVSQGQLGGGAMPPGLPAGVPGAPVLPQGTAGVNMPGLPPPVVPGAPVLPPAAAAAPVYVAPNPAILAVPGVPGVPPALPAFPGGAPAAVAPALPVSAPVPVPAVPPAAPVAPSVTPTTKLVASGFTYEQMRGAGWTDEALRREQYIV